MVDRTLEFNQVLNQSVSINKIENKVIPSKSIPASRSAFNEATSEVAKGIHKTSQVLTKLTKLVKSQGLFDDPTDEINSLIYRIKQDIDELNSKCDLAQQYINSKKSTFSSDHNQSNSHSNNVVNQLKSELMNTTKGFKSVLELRSLKMKDQQQRKVELTGKSILTPIKQSNSTISNGSNTLTNRSNHKTHNHVSPYASNDQIDYDFTNTPSDTTQLLLAPPNISQYYETREKAVTEVEKTIRELGQLFHRLSTMITQQQELIERIDDDIETSVSNAERAKNILLNAYEKASSNRGLYMKIFAILVIFILFFVLFLM